MAQKHPVEDTDRWRRKGQAGFSLAEILVALVILTIGIVPWVYTLNSNAKARNFSREMSSAMEIGQSKIEELAANATNSTIVQPAQNGTSSTVRDGRTYNLSWATDRTTLVSGGRSLWSVKVQVDWTFITAHNVTLTRLVVGQ